LPLLFIIKRKSFLLLLLLSIIILSPVKATEEIFNQLIKDLSSPSVEIRSEADWSLGELGDLRAVDYLIKTINDPDDSVRYYVIKSLGNLGDNKALPHLEKALKLEVQPWIVQAIEETINKLTKN